VEGLEGGWDGGWRGWRVEGMEGGGGCRRCPSPPHTADAAPASEARTLSDPPPRWATKQRTQRSRSELAAEKEEALTTLGFEWDEDEAEWLRWFIDLARFKEVHGHASPMQMSTGADLWVVVGVVLKGGKGKRGRRCFFDLTRMYCSHTHLKPTHTHARPSHPPHKQLPDQLVQCAACSPPLQGTQSTPGIADGFDRL